MDVAGIATTLGAGAGAAIGWFGSSGDRLNQAGTATSIGAAAGGALGVGIWSACRATAPAGLTGGPGADEDLLAQFRALARAEIRGQWRVLLDGRDRLDTTFSGYGTIAPPRGHAPPVRQGSDLVAAVDAAAAAGAPRLLIVGPPGHGKTVALLDAAQHLVDHHHDRFGSPVLLNLGSWSRGDRQLVPWIVRQLCGASGPLPGADSRILRRTGGGVQFRHGLLAARLAEDAPRPGLMDLRRRVGFDPSADTP